MKTKRIIAVVLTIVSTLLMLGALYMQYLPFWSDDEEMVSISDYVWMTEDYKGLTRDFKSFMNKNYDIKYSTNHVATMPVVVFVCSLVCLALCILRPQKWYSGLVAAIGGGYGAWTYLSNPLFQLGVDWRMQMVVCAAAAAVGIAAVLMAVLVKIKAAVAKIKKK